MLFHLKRSSFFVHCVRHLGRLLVPPHRDFCSCRTRQSCRPCGPLSNDPNDLRVGEQDDRDRDDVLKKTDSGIFVNIFGEVLNVFRSFVMSFK